MERGGNAGAGRNHRPTASPERGHATQFNAPDWLGGLGSWPPNLLGAQSARPQPILTRTGAGQSPAPRGESDVTVATGSRAARHFAYLGRRRVLRGSTPAPSVSPTAWRRSDRDAQSRAKSWVAEAAWLAGHFYFFGGATVSLLRAEPRARRHALRYLRERSGAAGSAPPCPVYSCYWFAGFRRRRDHARGGA